MKKLVLCALFLLDLTTAATAPAFALSNNATTSYDGSSVSGQVTIHGIVPVMRFIYVDDRNNILQVVGNTDQNITPRVIRASTYKDIALSTYINVQYQAILAANGGQLTAGQTYHLPQNISQPFIAGRQTGAPVITSLDLSI